MPHHKKCGDKDSDEDEIFSKGAGELSEVLVGKLLTSAWAAQEFGEESEAQYPTAEWAQPAPAHLQHF